MAIGNACLFLCFLLAERHPTFVSALFLFFIYFSLYFPPLSSSLSLFLSFTLFLPPFHFLLETIKQFFITRFSLSLLFCSRSLSSPLFASTPISRESKLRVPSRWEPRCLDPTLEASCDKCSRSLRFFRFRDLRSFSLHLRTLPLPSFFSLKLSMRLCLSLSLFFLRLSVC